MIDRNEKYMNRDSLENIFLQMTRSLVETQSFFDMAYVAECRAQEKDFAGAVRDTGNNSYESSHEHDDSAEKNLLLGEIKKIFAPVHLQIQKQSVEIKLHFQTDRRMGYGFYFFPFNTSFEKRYGITETNQSWIQIDYEPGIVIKKQEK